MLFNGTGYTVYNKEKILSDLYDASIDCINYLPEICRIVMTERYINKRKVEDIAKMNNMTKINVKNIIIRSRRLLNAEVQKRYSDLYNIYINSND
jgi:DNA-directed RNA polymerase specialized sigma24 family protein